MTSSSWISGWATALMGLLIGLGIAVAGYFASQTLLLSRTAVNTASVKGLSERVVEANQFQMTVSFFASTRSLQPIDRNALYDRAESTKTQVIAELTELGLSPEEWKLTPIRYYSSDERNKDYQIIDRTHTMSGSLSITSAKVDLADAVYAELSELSAKSLPLNISTPEYRFLSLNDIKPDMLREATQNARIAADEFAKNAGVTVGSIQNAAQGGFSIRDASDENQFYGDKQKRIRVVTTITFYLRD